MPCPWVGSLLNRMVSIEWPRFNPHCKALRSSCHCCIALSCLVLSCHVMSCLVLSYRVIELSCLVLSCHIVAFIVMTLPLNLHDIPIVILPLNRRGMAWHRPIVSSNWNHLPHHCSKLVSAPLPSLPLEPRNRHTSPITVTKLNLSVHLPHHRFLIKSPLISLAME